MTDSNGGHTMDWLENNGVLISGFVVLAVLDGQQGKELIFLWSTCRGFVAIMAPCVIVLISDHVPAAGSDELL